jgi:hypothetical protein
MADESRTQQVSLGCGTLILIALIVLIFSGRGAGDLEREVHAVRSEVGELKKAIEAQTGEIKQLQQRLDKPGAAGAVKER